MKNVTHQGQLPVDAVISGSLFPPRSQKGRDLAGHVLRAARWIRAGQQVSEPGVRPMPGVGC